MPDFCGIIFHWQFHWHCTGSNLPANTASGVSCFFVLPLVVATPAKQTTQHMSNGTDSRLCVEFLNHASPPVWRFPSSPPPDDVSKVIASLPCNTRLFAPVCVPFYSEGGASLRRSLTALALQQEDLGIAAGALHVFAIGDGWRTPRGARILSDSLLAELEALFGSPLEAQIEETFEVAPLVVLQRRLQSGELAPVMIDVSAARRSRAREDDGDEKVVGGGSDLIPLYLTVLIKKGNRKKSDSHNWFFGILAPLARLRADCEYYFTTDCGTLFAPSLLTRLAAHLAVHPRAGAATGHQRIMHAADVEGALNTSEEATLARIQSYDFESELCLFNGAHQLAGFLPVVPGPCGLFRASALPASLVATLRNVFASGAETDGLILANLKLAEDRVLSYLLLVGDENGENGGWETHWLPSVSFYFEYETTLRELVLQRRRWINGTSAGLLWILSRASLRRAMVRGSRLACAAALLSVAEVAIVAIVFFLPAIFIFTGFISIGHAAIAAEAVGALQRVALTFGIISAQSSLIVPMQVVYLAIAVPSFILHVRVSRNGGGGAGAAALWAMRSILGAFIMISSLAASLALLALCVTSPHVLVIQLGTWDVNSIRLSSAFCVHFLATPFCLSALHSRASLLVLSSAFPSFLPFFPVISADFFSYSLAQLDNLSWGTKAVSELDNRVVVSHQVESSKEDASYAARQTLRERERGFTTNMTGTTVVVKERDVAKPTVAATTAARITSLIALIHATLNVLLLGALIANSDRLEHNFALTASILSGPPAVFAVASFVFFTQRALSKQHGGSNCDRAASVITLISWITASTCIFFLVLRDAPVNYASDSLLTKFFGAYLVFAIAQGLRCACMTRRHSSLHFPPLRMCCSTLNVLFQRKGIAAISAFSLFIIALPMFGTSLTLQRYFGPTATPPIRPSRTAPLATGSRILEYLHARGEAIDHKAPSPIHAIYIDSRDVTWGDPCATVLAAVNASYNVINFAFAVSGTEGATDFLGTWLEHVWDARHNATVAAAHARGAVLLLSAGGATDNSYFRTDANVYGTALAHAALKGQLDGIDFDLEGFGAGCSLPGFSPTEAIDWVVRATLAARSVLGPLPLISHAPMAAYFSAIVTPSSDNLMQWAGPTGCYTAIYKDSHDPMTSEPAIDWFNVQFYNTGERCYLTYESTFLNSARGGHDCFIGTAVTQIASYGVPLSSILLGKVVISSDANSGFVPAVDVAKQMLRANAELGWKAGVTLWEWHNVQGPLWTRALDK